MGIGIPAGQMRLAATGKRATASTVSTTPNASTGTGKLTIIEGGNYSASEIEAAEYMKNLGYDVTLRPPTGTRAGGETSDLLVNGVNYDVFTPTTPDPSRIISAIAKKNSQTSGVVLDLSKTSVTASDLGDVIKRVQGVIASNSKGKACNIKDVVIMNK